jgi:hypothetical protein
VSYADWRDWALGNGDECPANNEATWRRVAKNADSDARYEHSNLQPDAFRTDLGEQHPTTETAFNEVCQSTAHQLSGASVDGSVPAHLARCVPRQALKTQLNERIEINERAGRSFRQSGVEDYQFDLENVPSDEWRSAEEILPDPVDDLHLSYFQSNRVFATPDQRPADENSDDPNTFFEHLQRVQRPEHSLAEEAVYRLALATSAQAPQKQLLLRYEADPFETFRYPVPPDAEFWPLFCPVEQGEDEDFGRTCPGGPPCDEERDEPELVHENPLISSDRAQMRAL